MSTFEQRLLDLQSKAEIELHKLIARYGVESEILQVKCLRVENKNYHYMLGENRYLTAVTDTRLVDNTGYHYFFSQLTKENFFSVIDHLIEKYQGIEQTTTIAQHEISYYLRDFNSNYLNHIPESDVEHIAKQILDGIHTGEICASVFVNEDDEEPVEYHGWWKIK